MTPLENRLVLHRFMCREFGYDSLAAMLDRLRDVPAGFVGNESHYAQALYLNPMKARVHPEHFADYDSKIAELSRGLRMSGERGREWKPHQYLALLFCEHYLRRYFHDPEKLRNELNENKDLDALTRTMPNYGVEELRTIAVQSATGSGKTLIMHAHLLQYRRLAREVGNPPNNVILLTPSEQLSAQHERDFLLSNIPARQFSSEAGADLLESVEIIDLNKLADKKGVKRVAVSDFGENNLVLVDEGHLGASGKVWRERRTELARGGFTFEYSATFNQITGNDVKLRETYGKCLLFDYSYRKFYEDGYGKDYAISNLPQGAEDDNSNTYLLGCLLSFYLQYRFWREGRAAWTEFNVTRPLWVFLGKTVTGNNKARADRETKSDVVRILDFLAWVLARGDLVRPIIAYLLSGESGLTDGAGNDYFAGRFQDLKGNDANALYNDICETLFHGSGRLHVVYLTHGEGELHLSSADNEPFGVVNIGDSGALYRLLEEGKHPGLVLRRDAGFARLLFPDVDREDSTVNVVIGARRFIAGWNSWRVSTMGLMHVGVGEGPEIIQMFGRGVRLKGWKMSLKRHHKSGAELPSDSHRLAELETLRVFGLRANYMQTFRNLLEAEGISVEQETITLPVTWNFAKKGLKIIRLRQDSRYERSSDRPVLPDPGTPDSPVAEMNLYSRLQAVESAEGPVGRERKQTPVKLESRHIGLFDRIRMHDKLLVRKRQMGWHNLTISRQTVDRLLKRDDWYELYLPPERLEVRSYADLQKLEDIGIELMADYAARFWRTRRARWEHDNIEVITLEESDPNNIREYRLSVNARETSLIQDIRALRTCLQEGPIHRLKLGIVMRDVHAYKPLLYATGRGEVVVQPVPLDMNEKRVAMKLAELSNDRDPCLQGWELFLIRNMTRGRGVSFFDDHAYFPDFIVWLKDGDSQHIVFLDPKGLGRFGPDERKKVRLHTEIEKIEKKVREGDPNLRLHAYVLSVTSPSEIGDEFRPNSEWEEQGVYFLGDSDWPKRVLGHVLGSVM